MSHIFFRHISSFYLCHAYAFCLLRVFSQPLSPLFSPLGYPYAFLPLYTQGFSLFWVSIRLFAFLYPKVFSLLGIHTPFSFSIPKGFLSSGYPYAFLLFYTQRFSLFWISIRLFLSLYPKFFLALGIYLAFVSGMPKLLYSSAYNGYFPFHRTVSLSFYAMASALTPPQFPALRYCPEPCGYRTSFISSIIQPSFSM